MAYPDGPFEVKFAHNFNVAFPERRYERLKTDAVCAGLSKLDERIAAYELKTTLKDSFVGLSYTYNDTGQSEGWMKTVLNETEEQSEQQKAAIALASDDGVIKAQVAATMQSLLIGVQDKVMTEMGVLQQSQLRSANWVKEAQGATQQKVPFNEVGSSAGPEIVEQPVWGLDCYTRQNISICLETEFDSETVLIFIERWLLPSINACPSDLAHNLSNAARILEGLPFDRSTSLKSDAATTTDQWSNTHLGRALLDKIRTSGPSWLKAAAHLLRRALDCIGPDFFRVHPKGHGSIVLCPKLEPNRLVTFYRGEVYPSWRWGEKMDAISLIQQKKGLKPVLPDFFNMALERPQIDPRGYGLLFVDASRKSGYGSMLSHSCQPSCEVRVAAVNGKLTLAMTTLREMTIGDELTFDYNAVTESLNEYQSAVCLCGHGQCRGSFLHFATADCYQQVLNRNSPIAVRLANLIKGCMKKVMSEDDERILKRHGFQTAAFGAVSVNRRRATSETTKDKDLDSMDFVPIWLRTYVADTLRYVEYERRALPIALICNELFTDNESDGKEVRKGNFTETVVSPRVESSPGSDDHEKPIKGSKPEPTFFFYSRMERESFISKLMEDDSNKSLIGIDLKRAIQKLASIHWKELDAEKKQYWKDRAIKDWERKGGKEKARLEEERVARNAKLKDTVSSKGTAKPGSKHKNRGQSTKAGKTKKVDAKKKVGTPKNQDRATKISFQAADGEGVSAMEQRIQQLTQTLSRIGRVLDRHREESLQRQERPFESSMEEKASTSSAASLRDVIHSPLKVMPDEHVVGWMWNHPDGIVRVLLKSVEEDVCTSPALRKSMEHTETKYAVLQDFGTPWIEGSTTEFPFSPIEGRQKLNDALMEFRSNLINGMQDVADEIKSHKSSIRKEAARKKKELVIKEEAVAVEEKRENDTRSIIRDVMEHLLDSVEERLTGTSPALRGQSKTLTEIDPSTVEDKDNDKTKHLAVNDQDTNITFEPWQENYNKRFKIEKAADLLLFYAKTSTFFSLQSYRSLTSSPIEVYARELGNTVPSSAIDLPKTTSQIDDSKSCQQEDALVENDENYRIQSSHSDTDALNRMSKKTKCRLCEPDDIIAEVAVEYQGDYVVSQLLQWYNAGIDQKPGLPDILGCIMLPSMAGSWVIDGTQGCSSRTDRPTRYHSTTRRRIFDWFKDSHKRGSPWPDDIRRAFVEKAEDKPTSDASTRWLPLGSPILDFLVTGDDLNINSILQELGRDLSTKTNGSKSTEEGFLSSVDQGRPAQAVSNWVQCENPDCLKWRKIPWHVDIDMLSEKFVCKDNVWNPKSASCEAPEDEWDETTDAQVDANGAVEERKTDILPTEEDEAKPIIELEGFRLGGKHQVRISWNNASKCQMSLMFICFLCQPGSMYSVKANTNGVLVLL